MKQIPLFNNQQLKYHGGQINQGKRKQTRPLATNQPIHLVLKCNKSISLFRNLNDVKFYINKYTWKFNIRLYRLSVQHDHIHLLIKIDDRESYKGFTRSLSGILARKYGKGLWQISPFTRVLSWGRDFQGTKKYIEQNENEIWGLAPYKKRTNFYKLG